jgi:hypothetical protein
LVVRVLRFATTNARIASTLPSRDSARPVARPDCAGRAASMPSKGVGLALASAHLPVRAIHLDNVNA